MERYWTMKYLQQRGITELVATVIKDGLARAEEIPLVISVAGTASLPRGARVKVRLAALDLLMLEASASLVERLDAVAVLSADEEEDDEPAVVHLAMDINEDSPDSQPPSST
jgi:exoribonuclease II